MTPHPNPWRRIAAAVLLLAAAPLALAADPAPTVVITTASGERLIGTVASEDADAVNLVSTTVGEVRIPRALIRTMTPSTPAADEAEHTAAGVTAAAAAPAPAPSPMTGAIQSLLHLPGKLDLTVGLGLAVQSGILEQTTWSGSGTLDWKLAPYDLLTAVSARRQSTRGTVIDNAFRWDNRIQRDLTPKVFLIAASIYQEDQVLAIDQETILFTGPGFKFANTPKLQIVSVVGPAYFRQQYLAAAPGLPAPPRLNDMSAVLYQTVSYTALPRIKLSGTGLIAQSVEHPSKQLAQLMLSLNVSLTEALTLSTSYSWQRDSRPRVGTAGQQGLLTTQLQLRL